jgi:hypothetical protein
MIVKKCGSRFAQRVYTGAARKKKRRPSTELRAFFTAD